jgi:ABC-type glycerol-3-phosphate transport system substrate-binding protein
MNNKLKTALLTTAIALSFAACSGNKTGGTADSSKVDSSSSVSSSTDTLVKTDSATKDTSKMAGDTTKPKVDTLSKTITKKTIVKKSVVKQQ